MSRRATVALLLALGLTACGDTGGAGEPTAPVRELYEGADAIRPFALEELRAGFTVGDTSLTRIETKDVVFSRSRIVEVDDKGYVSESTMLDEAMEPILDPGTMRWDFAQQLRYTSYKPGTVTMESVMLTTELGTFECWHLHTRDEQGWTEDAWYAKDLPGNAIKLESFTSRGTLLRRVVRVKDSRVAKPAADAAK